MPFRINATPSTAFRMETPAFDITRGRTTFSLGLYFKIVRNPSSVNHIIAKANNQLWLLASPVNTTQFSLRVLSGWTTTWQYDQGRVLEYNVPYYIVWSYNHPVNSSWFYVNNTKFWAGSTPGTLTDTGPRALEIPALQNELFFDGGASPDIFIRELWVAHSVPTDTQVNDLFLGTLTPTTYGALAYWNFDGTPGGALSTGQTALNDRIGSRHFSVLTSNPAVQYVANSEVSYGGVVGLKTARITHSGKLMKVTGQVLSTGTETKFTTIKVHPTIRVNGGAPQQLLAANYGTGTDYPEIYYDLHPHVPNLSPTDQVTLTAPLDWATASQGGARAEVDYPVVNGKGLETLPLPTSTTMRVGMNIPNAAYALSAICPYANVMRSASEWGGWSGAYNANGIPTGTAAAIAAARPNVAFAYGWGHNSNVSVPVGVDILLKVTSADPLADVRLTIEGTWGDPGTPPRGPGPETQGTATLLGTVMKPYGYVRTYRVSYIANPAQAGMTGRVTIHNGVIDNIELYYQLDPASPINPDSPPLFDPWYIKQRQGMRIIRTLDYIKGYGTPVTSLTGWVATQATGWRLSETRYASANITAIAPYNDAATGLVNYFNKNAAGGAEDHEGLIEVTTATDHGLPSGAMYQLLGSGPTVTLDNGLTFSDGNGYQSFIQWLGLVTATNKMALVFRSYSALFCRFNGTTDYFTAANAASLRTGASGVMTVAARVRLNAADSTTRIVFADGNRFALHYSTANRWRVRTFASDNVTQHEAVSTSAVVANQWYNLVAEINATTGHVRLWVDNGTVVETSVPSLVGTWTSSTQTSPMVGAISDTPASFFNGQMRDVAVWHRALTSLERTWLHNSGNFRRWEEIGQVGNDGSALKTSLRAYWTFRELQVGTDVVLNRVNRSDMSGNGCTLSEPTGVLVKSGTMARPTSQAVAAGYRVESSGPVIPPITETGQLIGQHIGADWWLCVPPHLSDAAVATLADQALAGMPAGKKIIVEYCNELWNFSGPFWTGHHFAGMTRATGVSTSRQYAIQTKRVHDIFMTRAAAVSRTGDIIRAMCGQFVNDGITYSNLSDAAAVGATIDWYGVAPYVRTLAPFGAATRHEHILDMFETCITNGPAIPGSPATLASFTALQKTAVGSVKLACYEMALEAADGLAQADWLRGLHITRFAQHSPRMRNLISWMCKVLQDGGVENACHYKTDSTANFMSEEYQPGPNEYKIGKLTLWGVLLGPQCQGGRGDGSDGLYDNRQFVTYSNNVPVIDHTKTPSLVSPTWLAYREWNALNGAAPGSPGMLITPGITTIPETGGATTIAVSLRTQPTNPVQVVLDLSTLSAVTLSADVLDFSTSNWASPQVVTVLAIGDSTDNPDRSVTVTISSESDDTNYNGLSSSVVITVADDDMPPPLAPSGTAGGGRSGRSGGRSRLSSAMATASAVSDERDREIRRRRPPAPELPSGPIFKPHDKPRRGA